MPPHNLVHHLESLFVTIWNFTLFNRKSVQDVIELSKLIKLTIK